MTRSVVRGLLIGGLFCAWLWVPESRAAAQEPRGEFVQVKHQELAQRDGKEGLLITIDARLSNLQGRKVWFSAFFQNQQQNLRSRSPRYGTTSGFLTVQSTVVPQQAMMPVNGLEMFLPYEEIDLPTRGAFTVDYYVEIQHEKDGKITMLADSGDFHFPFPPGAAAPPVAVGSRPDLFMLSVGIDTYRPPIKSLKGCVNDAEGMARVFQRQAGKGYGRVDVQVLTDANGTRANIDAGLASLRAKGKAGDWYVVVLSGHGGPKLNHWGFVTHEGGDVTDAGLLSMADQLAGEDKKVVIIIDACFAGQLRYAANPILNKYADPRKGGIILMLSSMPLQLSAALQRYSAFAQSVEQGLSGMADIDGDQSITLKELRRYTYNRVYELCRDRRSLPGLAVDAQDSAIDASMSIPESTPLAHGQRPLPSPLETVPSVPMPQLTGAWVSGLYRLKLDSNGVYRATISQANRTLQSGDGRFQANDQMLVLQNWQGEDRAEITALTSDELRIRFQGRDIVLKREGTTLPVAGGVAGTTWSGSEALGGFGALTFEFHADGKAVMIDAQSTVNGTWAQNGDQVTITFANCVYVGRVQGNVLAGNAYYTQGTPRGWTFSLTRRQPSPVAAQSPDAGVRAAPRYVVPPDRRPDEGVWVAPAPPLRKWVGPALQREQRR